MHFVGDISFKTFFYIVQCRIWIAKENICGMLCFIALKKIIMQIMQKRFVLFTEILLRSSHYNWFKRFRTRNFNSKNERHSNPATMNTFKIMFVENSWYNSVGEIINVINTPKRTVHNHLIMMGLCQSM